MQTIKVKDYNDKKGFAIKKRLYEYWKTLQKTNMQYLFVILFIQIINLILLLWIIQYTWGIVIHFIILTVMVSFLAFKWLRKQKFILFINIFIIPTVLLSFIIIVLLVGFKPSNKFPPTWSYCDNNFSRMATRDKFRVSQIELKYPVTFKMEVDDLKDYVEEWMEENGFSSASKEIPSLEKELEVGEKPEIIGYSFSFSYFDFKTLFGMVNDLHIRAIKWSDVWGGVKLEAHSNIRLGLKDYGSNIKFIESLYEFIDDKTILLNRSKLLWDHRA